MPRPLRPLCVHPTTSIHYNIYVDKNQ
jgi:hypothetical protein